MNDAVRPGSVDFGHLESYVAGDRAIVREVLDLFSDQARTVLPALSPTAAKDDWRHAAHSLKGSALGIGAFALAEACGAAEAARDESPEAKRAVLARVADAMAEALADIAAYTRG
ncbi:MAG: histidine phosphotransferase [Caulobacteraceae bacterium]|jgi:HPt (histidine-containing phosphotransfer) domain-containing protein|nr:histidine phosphotransferase [Caulobacteraceae bacterium]